MTVSNGHSQVVNIAHILYNIAVFSHFCLKKKKDSELHSEPRDIEVMTNEVLEVYCKKRGKGWICFVFLSFLPYY